jgi:large subunit ribosomal protein L15
MLQAHTLKSSTGSRKKKKRLGRGNASGRGTYAARGLKGQRSRSGGKGGLKRLGYKMILQRIPKKRGFNRVKEKIAVVSLAKLELVFDVGAKVTKERLVKAGLAEKKYGVKILGTGKLIKKLIISGIPVSKSAKEAIEKAGGSIE